MYKTIELEEEGGALSGYLVSYSDNNYKNFLSKEIKDEERLKAVIDFIERNCERIPPPSLLAGCGSSERIN